MEKKSLKKDEENSERMLLDYFDDRDVDVMELNIDDDDDDDDTQCNNHIDISDDNENFKCDFVPVDVDGFEYMAPDPKEYTGFFKALQLTYANQSFTFGDGTEPLITLEKTEQPLLFQSIYFSLVPVEWNGEVCYGSLYLYREGERNPIASAMTPLYSNDEVQGVFSLNGTELRPGRYFVVAVKMGLDYENDFISDFGDNDCFMFDVITDGFSLQHPSVKSCSIKIDYVNDNPHSNFATITVAFDKALPKYECLNVVVFTDRMLRLGESSVNSPNDSGTLEVSLTLRSKFMWIAETYIVMLQHNRTPFMRCIFDFDGKNFVLKSLAPLESCENDIHLLKRISDEDTRAIWQDLAVIPGLGRYRDMLIDCNDRMMFNSWRRNNMLKGGSFHHNFAVMNVSRQASKIIAQFVCNEDFSPVELDCTEFVNAQNTANPYEYAKSFFTETERYGENCHNHSVHLYNVNALLTGGGGIAVQYILSALEGRKDWSLFLVCSKSVFLQLLELYPSFGKYIPECNRIEADAPTLGEAVRYAEYVLSANNMILTYDAEICMTKMLKEAFAAGAFAEGEICSRIECALTDGVLSRVSRRIMRLNSNLAGENPYNKNVLSVIEPNDFEGIAIGNVAESFSSSVENLDKMVGLAEIKGNLHSALNRMRFSAMRRRVGLKSLSNEAHHMVFTGNPGTGKTTVAKEIGKIFHSLGLLSKGDVIVTERTKLVGRYIGDTEKNVENVLSQAKGNVLFIDEAYNLFHDEGDQRDFGMRVIESLLTVLAQPNPDMLVIFAGYEQEMERMLQSNPGLKGRFPHKFHFADYNADELMQIACSTMGEQDLELSGDARQLMQKHFSDVVAHKDRFFSNARWAKNFVQNGIIPAMADRLTASLGNSEVITDAAMLRRVISDDVTKAIMKLQPTKADSARQRIGFTAR